MSGTKGLTSGVGGTEDAVADPRHLVDDVAAAAEVGQRRDAAAAAVVVEGRVRAARVVDVDVGARRHPEVLDLDEIHRRSRRLRLRSGSIGLVLPGFTEFNGVVCTFLEGLSGFDWV